MAVASLVLGALGAVPLSVGLGIAALVRIHRRQQKGRAQAVVGLVLSGLWLFALVVSAAPALWGSRVQHVARSGAHGSMSAFDLRPGDCFTPPGSLKTVHGLKLLPCSEPHAAEVYSLITLQVDEAHPEEYPGEEVVKSAAREGCPGRVEEYIQDTWAIPEQAEVQFYVPNELSWTVLGSRRAVCFLVDPAGPQTGTLRRDRTNLTANQLCYLLAVKPFNDLMGGEPEGAVDDKPDEYRSFAGAMARTERQEARSIEACHLSGAAREPATAMVREIRAGVPYWVAASDAEEPANVRRALEHGYAHLADEQALAVREALDLATGEEAGLEV